MARYSGPQFLITSRMFHPTIGELESGGEPDSSIQFTEDYMNLGTYGKELAAFLENGLQQVGLPVLENYADDYGRIVKLVAPKGAVVEIACVNDEAAEANVGGDGHLIAVFPRPALLNRFVANPELLAFSSRIAEEVEKLLLSNLEIKLIRKYP
jgi:hypothetical protein